MSKYALRSKLRKFNREMGDMGENPEEILTKDALVRGNITQSGDQAETHQKALLAEQLKDLVKREVSK